MRHGPRDWRESGQQQATEIHPPTRRRYHCAIRLNCRGAWITWLRMFRQTHGDATPQAAVGAVPAACFPRTSRLECLVTSGLCAVTFGCPQPAKITCTMLGNADGCPSRTIRQAA